ncbi:hypothetical protein CORMATOL_02689 [Corynebacterium matruchotii ATCC 33806]|uniref:Uncharacterized protein n=1 Tax=Corynebacterium matruchotii ATCC 33806 TaxID=566549 RepID=C0E6Q3_9CORY|nr:hypothetical protein CORMATOL_02689 [Corynebacterium matruchotii ATCC 33806]
MFRAPAAVDDCNFNRFSSQTHGILLYQLPRACRLGHLGFSCGVIRIFWCGP